MKSQMMFNLERADCLTWLKGQRKGSYRMFVLDPPYNVGYKYSQFKDDKPSSIYLHEQLLVLAHCAELIQEGGSILYLNYPEFAAEVWGRVDFLKKVKILGWFYHSHLGGKPFRRSWRQWLWFSKGEPLINQAVFKGEYRNPQDPRIQERLERGDRPGGLDWFDLEQVKNRNHEKRAHPCQVPETMVEKFILGASNPGDLVGDCYTGSGTTAICALRHGRAFSGCEIDPAYVQVAREAVAREARSPEPCPKGSGSGVSKPSVTSGESRKSQKDAFPKIRIGEPDQADKEMQFIRKNQDERREALEGMEIRWVI